MLGPTVCHWASVKIRPLSAKTWPLSVQRWNANPNPDPNTNPNPNFHPVLTDEGHFTHKGLTYVRTWVCRRQWCAELFHWEQLADLRSNCCKRSLSFSLTESSDPSSAQRVNQSVCGAGKRGGAGFQFTWMKQNGEGVPEFTGSWAELRTEGHWLSGTVRFPRTWPSRTRPWPRTYLCAVTLVALDTIIVLAYLLTDCNRQYRNSAAPIYQANSSVTVPQLSYTSHVVAYTKSWSPTFKGRVTVCLQNFV